MRLKFIAAAMLMTIGAVSPSFAASDAAVSTLVIVKTPPGVTRAMIEQGFIKSVPLYEKIPGLIRKYFTVNDAGFGGMYLWKNRAAAEAWYSAAWRDQCKARYGVECQLTYFDTPLQIEGKGSK
jgi:hypothetical protein